VIIGLLHADVGHLGIFVSGKVAKKEHAQIVEVMKSIEMLPPGLYGMEIREERSANGKTEYQVEFREHRLEEVVSRINRLQRADERPFEAVAAVSEFNQRAYELLLRPLVQASSNELTAKIGREFHPLRFQRWAISDFNPWLTWLGPAAQAVKEQRQALPADAPLRKAEKLNAEVVSAGLDYCRAIRDAVTEAAFFTTYANIFHFHLAGDDAEAPAERPVLDPREGPYVRQALANIERGGYAEACARVACLVSRQGETLPLSRVTMRQDLVKDYASLLPEIALDQWRRIRGEQDIIVRYAPKQALETLLKLLDDSGRERLLTLLERVLSDSRIQESKLSAEQAAMAERVRAVLSRRPPAQLAVPIAR
jgi:hypothetical protein